MKQTFLLDMDGVLANFVEATLKLFDYSGDWPVGMYDIEKVLGVSRTTLWNKIDEKGESFWTQLPIIKTGIDLYEELQQRGEVFICTSPSRNPVCASGKLKWMQGVFGSKFRNFILTPHKYLLARPGNILIDDSEKNVLDFDAEYFEYEGCKAVLFPQPWNLEHMHVHRQVEFVLENL